MREFVEIDLPQEVVGERVDLVLEVVVERLDGGLEFRFVVERLLEGVAGGHVVVDDRGQLIVGELLQVARGLVDVLVADLGRILVDVGDPR